MQRPHFNNGQNPAGFPNQMPQRPTFGGGPSMPGQGPPQPGFGAPQPGFGAPQPGFGPPQPGFGGPQPGFGAPQPGFGSQPGNCFMPAATIRKISNTTPPRFDQPFQ